MLTKLQTQPFQYIISNIKKSSQNKQTQQKQDNIKRALKTLSQITNLNELLPILLDYHWFNKLSCLFEKLNEMTVKQRKSSKNILTYENLSTSPLKIHDQNRQLHQNKAKKLDLTPSTKKSKIIVNPSINLLMEDLIETLQKFDEFKAKASRTKLLIQELIQQFSIQQNQQRDSNQQIDLDVLWNQLHQMNFEELNLHSKFYLSQDKVSTLIQLFEQIQTIYKFMQVIRATTGQIFNLLQLKSMDQMENISRDSSMLDSLTKKSQNHSQQRSLLTEMLKDSSQRSNLQIRQNSYSSQIVLKQRNKQYSQKQDLIILNENYRISTKSVQPPRKSQKWIKSQMEYGAKDENQENKFAIRRKQIKTKRSQMGCSQCEIF